MKSIIIAGGCFWGVEAYFKQVNGVLDTEVGYIDGATENPTYEDVCSFSGHAEAVYIAYDSNILTIDLLLEHYLNIVDPTYFNRQGPDIGVQYRSGFYNVDETELETLKTLVDAAEQQRKKKFYITWKQDQVFYPAEPYHQDYLDKNPNGYCHVNLNSIKKVQR